MRRDARLIAGSVGGSGTEANMQLALPTADPLVRLAASLHPHGADGRAGLRALIRETESRYPGEIERMAAAVQLRKMEELRALRH